MVLFLALLLPLASGYSTNIASFGKAVMSQSYTVDSGAEKAIDGNRSNRWIWGSANTIMHTRGTGNSGWWRLDFAYDMDIAKVVIWNRMDCCQERIGGISVYLDNVWVGTVDYDGDTSRLSYDVDVRSVGRSVKLYAAPGTYMNLAEVQVLGNSGFYKYSNLLDITTGVATISRAFNEDSGARKAIDRNRNNRWVWGPGNSIMQTNGAPGWWKVTFAHHVVIDKIAIWIGMDCCKERVAGINVFVDDEKVSTLRYFGDVSQQVYFVDNIGRNGRRVILTTRAAYMNIAEVEVYGSK